MESETDRDRNREDCANRQRQREAVGIERERDRELLGLCFCILVTCRHFRVAAIHRCPVSESLSRRTWNILQNLSAYSMA